MPAKVLNASATDKATKKRKKAADTSASADTSSDAVSEAHIGHLVERLTEMKMDFGNKLETVVQRTGEAETKLGELATLCGNTNSQQLDQRVTGLVTEMDTLKSEIAEIKSTCKEILGSTEVLKNNMRRLFEHLSE